MKPTSFRLPQETIDLLMRLRQPGEIQASVIQRALIALAGQPKPLSIEALALRMDDLEGRVGALESGSAPRVQAGNKTPERGYSPEVRALAIKLKDAGMNYRDICAEIARVSGRKPHYKNIGGQIEQWRAAEATPRN